MAPLEIWGGVECARVRIGSRVVDQLDMTGHHARPEDLELFASLGIPALRYPVLWERVEGKSFGLPVWGWSDRRLGRLRELGIEPILGLLHHGNGPEGTSLLDPEFPNKLAAYAGRVAERYPWVRTYTPVNEPLTTARFAGLYGIWYPHGRTGTVFTQILLNQLRATVLAMRAILRVQPQAKLLQNEDVGTVLASPPLEELARAANEHRWLTFDLLCGRVEPGTEQWRYLVDSGASHEAIAWFAQNPCPPDLLGVDHYITSDRILDHRLEGYPPSSYAAGPIPHANVDAVRASAETPPGLEGAMRETWSRYRLPLVAAEVHLGSTRDEQIRWLDEAWRTSTRLREEGADVRAVTSWSLLGSFEWNSLLVRREGSYEPGAFDLRGGTPRPTAVAHLIRDLAAKGKGGHPTLRGVGWWRRDERIRYGSLEAEVDGGRRAAGPATTGPQAPVALVGDEDEPLTDALVRICRVRGLSPVVLSPQAGALTGELLQLEPWAVVVAPPERPSDPVLSARWTAALEAVLSFAASNHPQVLLFSSFLVFDGSDPGAYLESDVPRPQGWWGESLGEMERIARGAKGCLIVRTGARFGPWVPSNEGPSGRPPASVPVFSLSYLPDAVNESLDLLVDGESGIWHLVNRPAVSPKGLADLVERFGIAPGELPASWVSEQGPGSWVLGEVRVERLPRLEDALTRCFGEPEDVLFPVVEEELAGSVGSAHVGSAPQFFGPAGEPSATRSP